MPGDPRLLVRLEHFNEEGDANAVGQGTIGEIEHQAIAAITCQSRCGTTDLLTTILIDVVRRGDHRHVTFAANGQVTVSHLSIPLCCGVGSCLRIPTSFDQGQCRSTGP